MKKYLSFFRMRFLMGLQYRAAAVAGVITQFTWGFMELLVFRAFYQADASTFPMSFEAVASYIWLQQAFLALFMAWMMEAEIFPLSWMGILPMRCAALSIFIRCGLLGVLPIVYQKQCFAVFQFC